jgi:hypothetical protein
LRIFTVVGENALFLTATVFDEPACAGTTAAVAPIAATTARAASLGTIGMLLGRWDSSTSADAARRSFLPA